MKRYICSFVIACFVYVLVVLSGYAWYLKQENNAIRQNLQELIEFISESK